MAGTGSSPIDIILSGRSAAGCEKFGCLLFEKQRTTDNKYDEYLSLTISGKLCGINIMQIREIMKLRSITEIPGAPSFISGIISLRGVIVPVIDTRLRLGLGPASATNRERIVVVNAALGLTGLIVDSLIKVVRLSGNAVLPVPVAFSGVDSKFVSGIGRMGDRTAMLLNVEHVADMPPW